MCLFVDEMTENLRTRHGETGGAHYKELEEYIEERVSGRLDVGSLTIVNADVREWRSLSLIM
jgi:hypothetical protein